MGDKKRRGRPVGSGKDDSAVLQAIAGRILQDPTLKPTAVYKRLDAEWTFASVRRIQDKWRTAKVGLLAEAQARRDTELARRRAPARADGDGLAPNFQAHLSRLQHAQEQFSNLINGGSIGRIMRQVDTFTAAARVLDSTSFTRAARAIDGNMHTIRQLREHQERIDRMLGTYRFGLSSSRG
jgi:hypothetical protein